MTARDLTTAIKRAAEEAGVLQVELDTAKAALVAAEAEAIQQVVLAAMPGLRAISSRPRVTHVRTGVGTHSDRETESRATWAGFRVQGNGVEEDHSRNNTGEYEGDALYLLPEGKFVRLVYSGTWSRWQGAREEWQADEHPQTLAQAARRITVEELAEVLGKALAAVAAGNGAKRAAEMRARAERLRAIAVLARSSGW